MITRSQYIDKGNMFKADVKNIIKINNIK